jgi:CRP-like cAMP-binding protein
MTQPPTQRTPVAQALAGVPLLRQVPPEVLERFAAHAHLADAPEGGMIVDGEEESTDVYFVLRGTVRVTVRTPGGKEAILGDFAEGALFGEMAAIDDAPRSARIAAVSRARLAAVPARAFLELVFAAPEACHGLLRLLTARIRQQNERLLEHAALPSRHRLLAELLRLSRPWPEGGAKARSITPPPTQSDLAARIGVRREAVSREMAALARRGLIATTRGAIHLRDAEALRREVAAGLAGDQT